MNGLMNCCEARVPDEQKSRRLGFVVGSGEITPVEVFHFGASPGSLAEKFEAGFYAGIEKEAANGNSLSQILPTIMPGEVADHFLQGDAVKGIVGLSWCGIGHGMTP